MKHKDKNRNWLNASQLCDEFGTPRSWLRQQAEEGAIRRKELWGSDRDGTPRVTYLYSVEDVRNILDEEEA